MTLDDLNRLPRREFVDRVGGVFEHSPWVAERAWPQHPFTSLGQLHEAMVRAMEAGTPDEQLALLRAHPDLGTRARMSDASTSEQRGAGLDRLTPLQFETLQRLNSLYRERFGFPFLYAVKGSTVEAILAALEIRVSQPHDAEQAEALRQVATIARFRLEALFPSETF